MAALPIAPTSRGAVFPRYIALGGMRQSSVLRCASCAQNNQWYSASCSPSAAASVFASPSLSGFPSHLGARPIGAARLRALGASFPRAFGLPRRLRQGSSPALTRPCLRSAATLAAAAAKAARAAARGSPFLRPAPSIQSAPGSLALCTQKGQLMKRGHASAAMRRGGRFSSIFLPLLGCLAPAGALAWCLARCGARYAPSRPPIRGSTTHMVKHAMNKA